MFPYRPVLLNSRTRLLIAAFLAIAFHAGLMNFAFTVKPVSVPNVSFPRSVNIFLNQNSIDDILPAEPESQMEKVENATLPEEAAEDISRPAVITAEAVKKQIEIETEKSKTANEIIAPVEQKPQQREMDHVPEAGKNGRVQEKTPDSSTQVPDNTGDAGMQKPPGTIQMAFPRYRLNTPPWYPELARKRGLEGTVILQVLVDREGRVDELEIEKSSGSGLLDRAAVSAVKKWSFEPGRRDQEKITMWVRVPVTFTLKE